MCNIWSLPGIRRICNIWSLHGIRRICNIWLLPGIRRICNIWSLPGIRRICNIWSLHGIRRICNIWLLPGIRRICYILVGTMYFFDHLRPKVWGWALQWMGRGGGGDMQILSKWGISVDTLTVNYGSKQLHQFSPIVSQPWFPDANVYHN